ncbi:MAG TPA: alkaline phosphatase family protein [Acidimicrobiales bacterium]|nr:alkaline phosphatase family protein [Acidimicrobiales bacterium]
MDSDISPAGPLDARISRRALLGAGATAGLGAGLAYAVGTETYAAAAGKAGIGLGPGGSLLKPDSRPYPKLPAGTDTLPQIEHIVVIMMENHSFDDHLGMLGRGDGLTLDASGRPVNYNPDPAGGYVQSFHNPNTCGESNSDIGQSWNASHTCWDNGTNMGFVKGCSGAAMGYWTADDLPFYYDMARQFPIGDRYFCSVMAQTYPNRRFLIAGTALGDIATNSTGISSTNPPNGTIFERLDHYDISWKDYRPDLPTIALFLPSFTANESKVVPFHEFFADAASGNLPSVSLIDPYVNYSEESGDISIGEAYASEFINAVLRGPKWDKTALIWIYDEHGGWYDHVPPVPMVKPDNVAPQLQPGDLPGAYNYSGFRVPCCVVSAWAKKDYVSHQVFDHTSILKFIETKWNLPALTFRDANARNMLDFFDLTAHEPPFAEAPRLVSPRNPFPSTAVMPDTSLVKDTGFRPICQDLPAGSLPPPSAKLNALQPDSKGLLARHARTIQDEITEQDDALAGIPLGHGATGTSAGLIGGIVGGVVVLGAGGALALRRRRTSAPSPKATAPDDRATPPAEE